MFPTCRFAVPFLLFGAVIPLVAQDWRQRTPATSPAASTLPRMAFDVQRARAVAFGGWNAPLGSIVFQDTWEWNGTNWTLRTPALVPTERDSHVMAYDLQRGRTVMWGGQDFNFNLLTETLEWDGTNWVSRSPAVAPPGRILASMCYDTVRGVCVLFGGLDAVAEVNDTWEWNGTNWAQVSTAQSPSPRAAHAMAFDLGRARSVVFGGDDGTALLADTWEYDGTDWTQVVTDGAPPARVDAAMVYDQARARIVLFGGADQQIDRSDTWEFDGGRWHQVATATTPPGNAAMAAAYDTVRSEVVVFGGFGGTAALGATQEYGGTAAIYRTSGTGCAGSNGRDPILAAVTLPRLGQPLNLRLSDLPLGNGVALIVTALGDTTWNGQPLPLELTGLGLPGCRAYTSGDVVSVITTANGIGNFSFVIPNNPVLAGLVVHHQGLNLDAGVARPIGAALSNAGEATLR